VPRHDLQACELRSEAACAPPLSQGGTRDSARYPAPACAIVRRDGSGRRTTTAGRHPSQQRAGAPSGAPGLLPCQVAGISICARGRRPRRACCRAPSRRSHRGPMRAPRRLARTRPFASASATIATAAVLTGRHAAAQPSVLLRTGSRRLTTGRRALECVGGARLTCSGGVAREASVARSRFHTKL
jgi:hypothetical protein